MPTKTNIYKYDTLKDALEDAVNDAIGNCTEQSEDRQGRVNGEFIPEDNFDQLLKEIVKNIIATEYINQ